MRSVPYLAVLCLAPALSLAHGMMCWPYIRVPPGDIQNGWSATRSRYNDAPGGGECHGQPASVPLTRALRGGRTRIEYVLTATHLGGCVVQLKQAGAVNWTVVGEDATCGVHAAPWTYHIEVVLPRGTYSGVLRWLYTADNGVGELFDSCADIVVDSKHGTNAHSYHSCSRYTKGDTLYYPLTCNANEYRCTGNADTNIIQTCVNSYWYPIECPSGSKCVSSSDGNNATCVATK